MMKKINGGLGEELEVSDDIVDLVDPNSLLEESIPKNDFIGTTESNNLNVGHVYGIICLSSAEDKYEISSIFHKLTIKNNKSIEYEFIILKKLFLQFLAKVKKLNFNSFTLKCNQEECILDCENQKIKKIVFESFYDQIKCIIIT